MAALSLVLSACSASSGNETEAGTGTDAAPQTSGKDEVVELNVINFRVEDTAFYDEINKKFQEAYPNIRLRYDAVPTKDYAQLRTARLTTGDLDLFASGGEVELKDPDLRAIMYDLKDQPFLGNFYPDALKAGQYEGAQYFLPMNTTAMVTFYNKQMFEEHGLAVPTTWDEFIAVCEALKAKGIDPIIFGGKDQWPVNMIIGELEKSLVRPGGTNQDFYEKLKTEETGFNDPRWVEVFAKLQQLSGYFQPNATGLDYGQAPGLFAQGKAAMMIDGSWSLAQIEDASPSFETGVFLLPGGNKPEDNGTAATKYGFGWYVNKDSENVDAAMKYLEFLTQKDNYQQYTNMVRMLPVMKDVVTESPIINEVDKLMEKQQSLWENTFMPGAAYQHTFYAMELIFGKIAPEEAAANMQKDFIQSKPNWK